MEMALTRRSVIRGAGAAGSLLLAGGLPVWAGSEQAAADAAPDDYVRLSAALLGVRPAVLDPAARPGLPALADTFHALCAEAAPDALGALLAEYRGTADAGADASTAARRLLADGGGRARADGVGALARLTMLMWLYGVWYGGAETARMPASAAIIDPAHRTDLVVSVRAYRNGWIWRFAQTSPTGVADAPASWTGPPPDLDRFLERA